MPKSSTTLSSDQLVQLIHEIRGDRVMLDSDLRSIYGVETKALNRAVKRNRDRFPKDFVFQLSENEWKKLRYQTGTSSLGGEHQPLRYQIGTSSLRHGGRRSRPYAFAEHGAIMAANVLNSRRAVQMSVFVVRAFLKMREALRGTPELARKLAELEKKLTGRLDVHEAAIVQVLREVMQILNPAPEPEPPRRRIGFH
jgi:phage regulator Rha-like protein